MLSNLEKSYIAGFLDGDGCIMFQLIRKKDYTFGFQVRASIVFYQKSGNDFILNWLKSKLKFGYLRRRKYGMTEYTIVGLKQVMSIIKLLKPYLKLKKKHADLALRIENIWPEKFNEKKLLQIAKLADGFKKLNYSKKRKITREVILEYFKNGPRND